MSNLFVLQPSALPRVLLNVQHFRMQQNATEILNKKLPFHYHKKYITNYMEQQNIFIGSHFTFKGKRGRKLVINWFFEMFLGSSKIIPGDTTV